MIVDEFALPTGREADRLLFGMSRLIEQRGAETFLTAPLLLAEPRYFPDPVEPRARGVAVLLRRLLAYAGLEPDRLDIEIYGETARDPHVELDDPHDRALAWFMDIADGVYRFGVRETELRDEQALIGTLGHEVAHAYRAHHRLAVVTRGLEEELTDLTTVYLGFGVFTLESSFQFKTGHYNTSGQRLLYERQSRGYLRPGQLAFLLGAQLVVRGVRENLLQTTLDSLSENHAAAVKAAVKLLREDQEALFDTLRLPPATTWPPPQKLEDALAPLPPTKVQIRDRVKAKRVRAEADQIGFRIAGTRLGWGIGIGFCAGFAGALALDLQLAFWPLSLGLGLVGSFVGRRFAAPSCSGCGHVVAVQASRCNFCKVRLVGNIRTPPERLDAEERYRAELVANVDQRRAEARGAAQQTCPWCDWVPLPTDRWSCSCGETWHTFDTGGRCPGCDKQWETTACLSCRQTSAHDDWYLPREES